MAFSKRRLATTPSHRTQTMPHLAGEIETSLPHQQVLGRSEATVRHYADSLRLLMRCYTERKIPLANAPTSETMNTFAAWLRKTRTRLWRGKTQHSIHGVHGILRDTCFTLLVTQNTDLHTIKRLVGHTSVTTTEAHLTLSQDELKAKHNIASPCELIRGRVEPQSSRSKRRLKSA